MDARAWFHLMDSITWAHFGTPDTYVHLGPPGPPDVQTDVHWTAQTVCQCSPSISPRGLLYRRLDHVVEYKWIINHKKAYFNIDYSFFMLISQIPESLVFVLGRLTKSKIVAGFLKNNIWNEYSNVFFILFYFEIFYLVMNTQMY